MRLENVKRNIAVNNVDGMPGVEGILEKRIMILPNDQLHNACQLGLKWLKDPKTKILYLHKNGVALENDGYILSVANGVISFEDKLERKKAQSD